MRVVDFLRREPPGIVEISRVAVSTGAPENITLLAAAKIIHSHRGRIGGVSISIKPVSLYAIVVAVEENISLVECTHSSCKQEHACGLTGTLKRVQRGIEAHLKITHI
jgi:DNA-binding IscR family transcriptional regulator